MATATTTIMIVDDSALSRRMMRGILGGAGHSVIEESDGIAALARYEADRPRVVMLDLLMAGMYGLDVLIALRRIDPDARVIIASADVQVSTRDEVLAAGACGFVGKPFAADAVLGAVASALVPVGGAR